MRIRSATGYLVLGRTVAIGDSTFCQLIDRRGPGLFVPQQEQQQTAEPNVRREHAQWRRRDADRPSAPVGAAS